MKATVTKRALFARIDRKLQKDGERLRRCKESSKAYADLGDYYVVSGNTNTVIAQHCSLEGLAKELGLLAAWEVLEE